jgi:tRNA1Val (adenine37-N6)-methyltransferase
VTDTTEDRFLDGRVRLRQPKAGFRAGLDAVMLAAAVPAEAGESLLELGSGVGTASLCLAARVPGCAITGVEIDAALAALAAENARGTALHIVEADVFDLPKDLRRGFAHVFCNPPFHDGEASPDPVRDRAMRDAGRLGDWLKAGLKRTESGGTFTAILRADRLAEALARLPERGTTIFPLWPRADEPAKRVIIQVRNGSRAASVFAPGLVLHAEDGSYTRAADAILRGGAKLDL